MQRTSDYLLLIWLTYWIYIYIQYLKLFEYSFHLQLVKAICIWERNQKKSKSHKSDRIILSLDDMILLWFVYTDICRYCVSCRNLDLSRKFDGSIFGDRNIIESSRTRFPFRVNLIWRVLNYEFLSRWRTRLSLTWAFLSARRPA